MTPPPARAGPQPRQDRHEPERGTLVPYPPPGSSIASPPTQIQPLWPSPVAAHPRGLRRSADRGLKLRTRAPREQDTARLPQRLHPVKRGRILRVGAHADGQTVASQDVEGFLGCSAWFGVFLVGR